MAEEPHETAQSGAGEAARHPWWNSLDARMYLRFTLMVSVMVVGAVWLIHSVLEGVVEKTGARYAEAMGNRLIEQVEGRLAAAETLAAALAGAWEETPTQGVALDGLAAAASKRHPFITGAAATRNADSPAWTWGKGAAFAEATGWPDSPQTGMLAAVAGLPTGQVYWLAYAETAGSLAGQALAVLPLQTPDGRRIEAAVLLDMEALLSFLPESLPPRMGYVLLTARDNQLLAAPSDIRGGSEKLTLEGAPQWQPIARALEDLLRALTAKVAWEESEHGAIFDALTGAGVGASMRAQEVASAAGSILDVLDEETKQTYLLQSGRLDSDPRYGVPAHFAVFHVPGPYWRLTLVKPHGVLAEPFGDSLLTLSASIVTVMLVPPAIVLLLLRRDFVRPVRHLSRYLMGVRETEGDFLQGLGEGAPNELVELAQAFNQRTEALRAANVQLRREFEVRERAEVALRESEARFRSVLENTRDMLCELNLITKRYEYVSPASRQVLGFTPEEFHRMGPKALEERIHPDDATLDQEIDKRLFDTPSDRVASAQVEYRIRNRDGDYVWVSENRTLVRDKEGRPAAIVGSMRDVTERRLREQEIRRVRTYLRNILDSMPSILVGVDGKGYVTHWNTEAARTTRAKEQDVLGRPFEEAFPVLAGHAAEIRGALEAAKPLSTQRIVADGEEGQHIYYDLLVYPLGGEGVEGAVIRIDDVSSRVQIEEMMVQTEKMMSVGGLAAGMAHEINNPLGGILQACQNLERRTKPGLPKNQQVAQELGVDLEAMGRYLEQRGVYEFIAGIRDDGQRAAKIVADMLAFSRRSESHFAPANLPDLVHTALRLAANDYDLKKHYDFRRIAIEEDFDSNLPQVRCDKTKIEQVLLNLVKNAAQAMGESEGLEDPRITVRLQLEGEWVQIEVIDNGPGMDEKTRRRVFEPFFTTKEPGVGTGLGLSVSYFIITKQHRGTMKVEPAAGRGTRFIIRLPLNVES